MTPSELTPVNALDSARLDQVQGFIELTFPGRQFIVWLFEDHTKHEHRLLDTPVAFCKSAGIPSSKFAENLMAAKLEKWNRLDEQGDQRT